MSVLSDLHAAPARLRYVPSIDGLRAVAVLAVMVYHSGLGWLPGGFLGVDLFFVLSGYLITTLLIREWEETGTIDLVAFWGRRARRLLPAILLVLTAVAVYGVVAADPATLDSLRFDGLATLGYVVNWRFIFTQQSYFESFAAPSPLRHMWSLAVEEQWYLIWPVVLVAAMRRLQGRTPPMVAVIAAAAGASAVVMSVLHTPYEDPSRAYFGTDTRAHTLLVGAALAFVLRPGGWTEASSVQRIARWWRITAHTGGTVAGAAILGAFLIVQDGDSNLYEGGFLLFALGAALVIGAAIAPGPNVVKSVLSPKPLQAVGRISYGLYLWHWPVNIVLVPDRVGTSGVALALVRTAVTFAFATASFVLVERPIRLGRVRFARPAWVGAGAVVATALVVLAATVNPSVSRPANAVTVSALESSLESSLVSATPPRAGNPPPPAGGSEPAGTGDATEGGPGAPPARSSMAEDSAAPAPARPVNALLVGDSVAFTLGIGIPATDTFHLKLEAILGCASIEGKSLVGSTTYGHEDCRDKYGIWRQGFDRPIDIALLMVGAWEVFDRVVDGRRIAFGTAEHRSMMHLGLQRDIDALVAAGAPRVGLFNVPCFREVDDSLGGSDSPRNDPERVALVNDTVRAVAAANPDIVVTIDLASFLCPGGESRESLDGVELRPDGVHFSEESTPLVWRRWLMPLVIDLARGPNR